MTTFELAGYADFELIHRDRRHAIHRARRDDDGREVVVKTPSDENRSASALAALRHEHDMLLDLTGPGVVRVDGLVSFGSSLALVTFDAGPENLASRLDAGPLPAGPFLDMAVGISRAVATVHGAGRIHRDLNPANIAVDGAGNPTLLDFEFATPLLLLEEKDEAPGQLVGTLPYIAPEQTGRIGRSIDARSDLYSLGATFYEMLTGVPPFGEGGDELALVHAHIARRPEDPASLVSSLPRVLADLVLKLLAKAPEDRYQTAEAVLADLVEARDRLRATGGIDPFPLARGDVPRDLRIPEKIYGRESEASRLLAAFDRASAGGAELILVTGAPGIGKSALVRLVRVPIAEGRGFFLSGKFDQLQRAVPYSALSDALRELVRQLLAFDDEDVAARRKRILDAANENGRILIDLVPEMERLLGPQPPLLELGPDDTANRFLAVVKAFLAAVADAGAPLVLFLDDLQWIDPASLRLLESVLAGPEVRHLLVIGAYRDEEVGPTHPLAHGLRGLAEMDVRMERVHLGALSAADVTALCGDAFACAPEQAAGLAALLVKKTAGNPFFLHRMIRALHAGGQIRFDPAGRIWTWDLEAVASAGVADNVLALMSGTIERLAPACRELLGRAACIGNRFDLGLLAEIADASRTDTADALFPALEEGLLLAMRDSYQAPRRPGPHDAAIGELAYSYRFVHDRVQQAAYELTDEPSRRAAHLKIGRALLEAPGENLFAAVDHLDLAVSLIPPGELAALAELNRAAGSRAKQAGAYRAALEYLTRSGELAPSGDGDANGAGNGDGNGDGNGGANRGRFALEHEKAECAYLAGDQARADELIERALPLAPTKSARAELFLLRINVRTCTGDVEHAIESMRRGLIELGGGFPRENLAAEAEAAVAEVMRLLAHPGLEAFGKMPLSEEPAHRLRSKLLATGAPAAWASGDPPLLAFIMARLVVEAFAHGHTEDTPFALAAYALVHAETTGDQATAYAIGRLGVDLARARPYLAMRCVTIHIFASHVNHWSKPLRTGVPLLREAVRYGLESGEHKFASFGNMLLIATLCELGCEIPELSKEIEACLSLAARVGNRPVGIFVTGVRQFVRCLEGRTRPGGFEDAGFDEAAFLADGNANYPPGVAYYWNRRLCAAVVFGDSVLASRMAEEAEPMLRFEAGFHAIVDHAFYAALALTGLYGAADPTASLTKVRELEEKLAVWAGHCPENVAHRRALVAAEIARIGGNAFAAIRLYDHAAEGARAAGFVHDEALANELAGRFCLAAGAGRIARMYLQSALDAYARWGASAKVSALQQAHKDLLLESGEGRGSISSSGGSGSTAALDAIGIMKASQAISGEIVSDRLLERLVHVLLEVAGADRMALLLEEEGRLQIRARGLVSGAKTEVKLEPPPIADAAGEPRGEDELPAGVLQLAWRTGEPVVIADARSELPLSRDSAVRSREIRSVLCVPLPRHGRTAGLVYLENGVTPHAFTRDRVELVRHLAVQLAISLENGRLYGEAQHAVRMRDEFLAVLSHELRNPLAPIRNSVFILERATTGGQQAKMALGIIGRQLTHMARLVDDLLDVTRISRGKVRLHREPVILNEVVRSAGEDFRHEFEERGIELRIAVTEEPLRVNADRTRIVQIIGNLLQNAARFTSAGGKAELRLERGAARDAVLQVRDDGAGIEPGLLGTIFEPFVQAEQGLDRSRGGLGLGLALVKGFAEMQGGTVSAHSEGPGRGAVFTVRLPLDAGA